MSQYVNLEMSYSTYSKLCDAVEEATNHAEGFFEIQDLVHLYDFLEEEFERDREKRYLEYKTWKSHEKLFTNKEPCHYKYFNRVRRVLDNYVDAGLLKLDRVKII